MSCEFDVASAHGTYSVRIADGALGTATRGADVVVVDAAVAPHLPAGSAPSIELVASEAIKTLAGVEFLALKMREYRVDRSSMLCAVGGGTIQDVATLTSSLYMRGIKWVYAPSTLMAMADSCIGGKSAINAGGFKNLLGNINPPGAVIIDPSLALTQTVPEQMSGIAEAVKICFTAGPDSFERFIAAIDGSRPLDARTIALLVEASLLAKKEIVEEDEFDRGRRQLLNFGHTFGHALESATGMELAHGLGVALGMLSALDHPLTPPSRMREDLRRFIRELLGWARGAGWVMPEVDWTAFERAFASDKKHTSNAYRVVLPDAAGTLSLVELPKTMRSLVECRDAAQIAVAPW